MWNNDTRPYVPHIVFFRSVPQVAREWAASKLLKIAPFCGPPDNPNQTLLRPHQKTQQSLSTISDAELHAILQRLPHVVTPTKEKEPTVAEKLGMSSHELEMALAMCGLQDGEEFLLPI